MRHKTCDRNCLECKLPKCIHDIEDEHRIIDLKFKAKQKEMDKVRHAKYYLEHKAEIDAKQKEYDKKFRKAEKCHEYYVRHKAKINQRNKERYEKNRVARLNQAKAYYWEHRDEINARRKRKRDQAKIAGGEK